MPPSASPGQPEGAKDGILTELGHRLWDQQLGPHLAALRADPPRADRARVLVVTNSYRQCSLLAHGMAEATDPARLAVAVSPDLPAGRPPSRPGRCSSTPGSSRPSPTTAAPTCCSPRSAAPPAA